MDDITHVKYDQTRHVTQRQMEPGATTPSQMSLSNFQAGSVNKVGPKTMTNGSTYIVQEIYTAKVNAQTPLGVNGYAIAFFQGSISATTMIGTGLAGWQVKGPFLMPTFTPLASNSPKQLFGGSTGNNLVFVTELYNNTGSTQTMYYISQLRFSQPIGGGVIQS